MSAPVGARCGICRIVSDEAMVGEDDVEGVCECTAGRADLRSSVVVVFELRSPARKTLMTRSHKEAEKRGKDPGKSVLTRFMIA